MKNLKAILLAFIIYALFFSILNAQTNQIGLDIGYGLTNSIDKDGGYYLPNYKDIDNYYRLGFMYYCKPEKKNFHLLSGINLDYNSEGNINLAYVRLPLGIESGFKNNPHFVYGGGFFFSRLIYYDGIDDYSAFEESLSRNQFGIFGNFGLEYQISPKYIAGISFQSNVDITKLYEEYTSSPGGTPYVIRKGKGMDIFFKMNLKYRFMNK